MIRPRTLAAGRTLGGLALSLALSLALATPEASAKPRVFYKYVRRSPARVGQHLKPRFTKQWMRRDARHRVDAKTERLLEATRARVAPNKPSRLGSVFAATNPEVWKNEMGDLGSRSLIKLAPYDSKAVTVVNARHYERAFYAMVEAEHAPTVAKRKRSLAKAKRAARAYWTKPATGKRALPEVLLGGGAIFKGKVSTAKQRRKRR